MLFQLCSDGHKAVHEENGVGMDGRGKETLLHISHAFAFFSSKTLLFVTEKGTRIWISGTSVEFDAKTRSQVCMSILLDFFKAQSRAHIPSVFNMAGVQLGRS